MVMPQPKPKHKQDKFNKYFRRFAIPIFAIDDMRIHGSTDCRLWLAYNNFLFPFTCTGCGKPITKKEAKQFDNQCYGCWYETQQERTLNEGIER